MNVTRKDYSIIAKAFSATDITNDPKYKWKWSCRLCQTYVYMSRIRSSNITLTEQASLFKHIKSAEHTQEQILKQLSNEGFQR